MHETALVKDLVRKVESVVAAEQAVRATRIRVWLGALSHLSAGHFREHFRIEAAGTAAAGAELEVAVSEDPGHPQALGVVLQSVDVGD